MFFGFLTLSLFVVVMGVAIPSRGCPKVEPMKGFDMSQFWGDWYITKRYESRWNEKTTCVKMTLTPSNNEKTSVTKSFSHRSSPQNLTLLGDLRALDRSEPAKLLEGVDIGTPLGLLPQMIYKELYILGTDYKTYGVVWACGSEKHETSLHIYTRERNPPARVIDEAIKIASKNDVDVSPEKLQWVRQTSDCLK